MRRLGALPTDWPDFARSLVPLALLAMAATVVPLRIPVLIALGAGVAVGIARDAPVRWAWAATIPVALSLAWGVLPAPAVATDGSDCASLGSPVATWRVAEAVLVLASVGVLATVLHASRASLFLRRPARAVIRIACAT